MSTGPQVGRGTPARGFGCLACAGRCWHHHKHPTQWPSQWLKVGLGLSQVPEASRFPPWSVCAFQSCEGKTERMCGGRLAECLAHNKLNKCQLHLVRATQVFLPGKSQGQKSLAGYGPWGCKESDTTEHACRGINGLPWWLRQYRVCLQEALINMES